MKKLLILVLGIFLLVPGVSWAQTQVPSERIEDDFEATTITVSDTASADTIVVSDSFTIQRSDSQFVITSVEWTSDIIIGEGSGGTYLEIDGQTSDPGASDRLASKQYVDDNAGGDPITSLPRYENLGGSASVSDVELAVGQLFNQTAAFDPQSNTQTTSGSGSGNWVGGIYTPEKKVVFTPNGSDTVGIFDLNDNTWTDGPTHGEGASAFWGSVLAPNGDVVFVPNDSSNVGVFDPVSETYTSGATHGQGSGAFGGGCLAPDGRIILSPRNQTTIGLYDASGDTFSSGPDVSSAETVKYIGCAMSMDGRAVFTPQQPSDVVFYDPSSDTITEIATGNAGGDAYYSGSGCLVSDGRIVLSPRDGPNVGLVDPSDNSFSDGPAHGQGTDAFQGCVTLPDGRVLLYPRTSGTAPIGLFDPSDDSFTTGVSIERWMNMVRVPDGRLIAANGDREIFKLQTWTQTKKPDIAALHPLISSHY